MARMGRKARRAKARARAASKRAAKSKRRKVAKRRRPAVKKKPRKGPKPRATPKRRMPAKAKRRPKVKASRGVGPKKGVIAKRIPEVAKPQSRRPARRPPRHLARVSAFIGASVDGFIARSNHDLDFLEVPGDPKGEDYGYNAFVGEIDAIVMGRKTFEKVLTFKSWPYGKTPVVVLTTRPLPVPARLRGKVETMSDRPAEVVERLGRRGLRRLYLDGGRTIQGFLRAGLVDEVTITRVPVLLGQGVPLFGALPQDVRLRHLETRTFRSGMVQTTYAVKRGGKTGATGRQPTVEDAYRPRVAPPARANAPPGPPAPVLDGHPMPAAPVDAEE